MVATNQLARAKDSCDESRTRDVGAQACMKTLTMIFANVRAVFVRAFIIKNALLETGHVSRSQTVCLVSKRYTRDICSTLNF